MSSLGEPPQSDELEISVFGPGVGECIVMHLGSAQWVVVDSCNEGSVPVAQRYLETDLGVPLSSVSAVVLTHWHDDHVRGAATLLERAVNAQFYCSAALKTQEFLQLIKAGDVYASDTGTKEMARVLHLLHARKKAHEPPASVGPCWLAERQLVTASDIASLWALSPSSTTQTLSHAEIAGLLPTVGAPIRNVVAQSPNRLAVALALRVEGMGVLLGSDLEKSRDARVGWGAAADAYRTLRLPISAVVKVPHHGSEGAHDDNAWRSCVGVNAISVTTPYQPSRLPRDGDLARLRRLCAQSYVTAPSSGPRTRLRELRAVMGQTVRSSRTVASRMGHVRIRFRATDKALIESNVSVFGAARRDES